MKLNKITIAIAAGAVALSATIAQADVKPAVVYDKAGKFDKSFNEAVWNGVKRFTADTGISVREVEPTNEAQVEQGLKKLAKRGNSPIVAVGFSSANALSAAAQAYPDTKFTLIDMVVPEANVQNVVFKEHEGSFLVGALAALKSETGTIGFVGGMDIPLISRFGCGYEQGAKHINANITVLQKMTGSTPAAWGNPSKGGEITRSQIEAGADVVMLFDTWGGILSHHEYEHYSLNYMKVIISNLNILGFEKIPKITNTILCTYLRFYILCTWKP